MNFKDRLNHTQVTCTCIKTNTETTTRIYFVGMNLRIKQGKM